VAVNGLKRGESVIIETILIVVVEAYFMGPKASSTFARSVSRRLPA
jgi:hypothetical protein